VDGEIVKRARAINEQLKQILVESYKGLAEDAAPLFEIRIERCSTADHDHYKDPRVFAHTHHKEDVICVSSSIELLDDANIYGVLAHEYGHMIYDQFPELIFDAQEYPNEFEVEIDREYGVQFVEGVEVDIEIFADWIVEKLFGLRIWYDQRKVQWLHLGG
jgi:hypothetical protein